MKKRIFPQVKLGLALCISLTLSLTACKGGAGNNTTAPSFKADVEPLLKQHCGECHLPGGKGFEASGFSVENYASVMQGTRLGPVIVPGKSVASTLVILIEGKADPSIRMPHGKEPLDAKPIKTIKEWIDAGAKDN